MTPTDAGARSRTYRPPWPLDLDRTLAPLAHGRGDPCVRRGPGGWWRASRTPEGPVTTHLAGSADGTLRLRAWGPGAGWALAALPELVGAADRPEDLAPGAGGHPVVAELARHHPGLRLPRTEAVLEALVPAVLAQKVTGVAAKRAWAGLVRRCGEPAPGPAGSAGLRLPPTAERLARTPTWVFHRLGVEARRAEAIRVAAACADALERLVGAAPADARRRLQVLPGIGPWTAAEVTLVALGDADAVSVGDFHLPHHVAWTLAGEARADDARMLELLEPYRPQRGRVVRLIEVGAPRPPRFGPRLAVGDITAL